MDKKALDGRFIKLEFPWPTTGSSRALSYDETQILLCAITEEGTLSQIRFFRDKDYLTAYVEEPGTYALFLNDLDHGNGLDDLKDAARPFAPGEAVPGSPDRKDEDPSPDTGVAPTGLSALLLMLSGVAALLLRGKKKGETPR